MNKINCFINSIVLSAVGDAMGWMTEFHKNQEDIQKNFNESQITKFHDWAKFNGSRFNGYLDHIQKGSYSDDTQLMLAVARSIVQNRTCHHEYFAKTELVHWLDYKRGAGKTITKAAHKIQRKAVNWNNNFFTFKSKNTTIDYRNCGANGAAMRILPISLTYIDNLSKSLENIFYNSIITHGHPRAIIGSMLYGLIINTIYHYNFSKIDLITFIGKNLRNIMLYTLNTIEKSNILKNWFEKWQINGRNFRNEYTETIEECLDTLRNGYKTLVHNQDLTKLLDQIGLRGQQTKGAGTISVLGALFCYCKYNVFGDGLLYTVNLLGADTDSVAAFYCAMYGISSNSNMYQSYCDVQDFDYLINIGKTLFYHSNQEIHKPNTIILNTQIDLPKNKYNYTHPALGNGCIIKEEMINTITTGLYIIRKTILFSSGQSAIIIERVKA